MRLLLLGLAIYVAYMLLKKWMGPGRSVQRRTEELASGGVDDVMVKDPSCGTYYPQRGMIRETIDGKIHYFCSDKCRDKYLELHK